MRKIGLSKRTIISGVFTTLFFLSLPAQDWVTSFGHRLGDAVITALTTDRENHVLVTGTFSSNILVLGEKLELQSEGMEDVFLLKYTPEGEIAWARSFGGQRQDFVNDMALDGSGNIYLTGNFRSTAIHVGEAVVTSSWPENVYVAKFNSSGEFQWLSKSEGLTAISWSRGTAVYCQGEDEVYFSGFTNGQNIRFGDMHLSTESENTKGFYGKLDVDGHYLSASMLEGAGKDRYFLNDIVADTEGNMYLAGMHSIHKAPDPITYLEYRGIMYFCKIGPDGHLVWAVEDRALYEGTDIILHDNSLFVLGNREEYRSIYTGGTVDTSSSFFFGRMDKEGNRLQGRKVTGAMAYGMYADSDRILIAGGLYLDHLELDGTWIHRNSDSSSICPIYQDIFFFESDLSGNIGRVESISGSLEDEPAGIWLSDRGDLFYAGTYESASLTIEENEIFNDSRLSTMTHISGIYYDRRQYSFLARREGFAQGSGTDSRVKDHFGIYPNPASGMVRIEREDASGKAMILVYDLMGRLLATQLMEESRASMHLGGFERGVVIVSLREGHRTTSRPMLLIK
jgi:hypothetical protein